MTQIIGKKQFPSSPGFLRGPVTIKTIDDVMDEDSDERDDKLDDCDEKYYETGEDIADRLFEFIKSNRDKIMLR